MPSRIRPSHRLETRRGPRVAVVGATGMVGRELLRLLEKSRFPISELLPFSSGRTVKSVLFRGRRIQAPAPTRTALRRASLAFFVSADHVSRRLAPALSRAGTWIIDDSSAFRLTPGVPLVIPEINAAVISPRARLIAGPNCTMSGLAVAAAALTRRTALREIRIASYQAVSGAGQAALAELFAQTQQLLPGLSAAGGAPIFAPPRARELPGPIAFNVVPRVGDFGPDGYSGEENKVAAELRKVLGLPRLSVSATAVRVPTVRGHCLAAWLRFTRPLSVPRARSILARSPGVTLLPEGKYATPLDCGGKTRVFVSRVRRGCDAREIALWVASDNLLKGAAYNSLQIARELRRRGWL